jgi:hypothetical protein
MPTSLPKHSGEDQRNHRRWAVSFFAGYAIALACLFGFMATHPNAVKSVADAAQAEYVGAVQPAGDVPLQLAARKATIK